MSSPHALMAEGERLALRGQTREAMDRFEAAHRQLTEDPRVLLRMAAALGPSDPDAALRAATRATRVAPRSAAAHALRAKYALMAGDPRTATEAARRALELGPDNAMAQTLVHLATAARGDYGLALAGLVRHGIFEQSDVTSMAMECFLSRWWQEGPLLISLPAISIPRPSDSVDAKPTAHSRGAARDLHSAYFRGDAIGMLWALAELRRADPSHEDVASGYAAALHLCGRDDLAEPWVRRALDEQRAAARRVHEQRDQRLIAKMGKAITRRKTASTAPPWDLEPEPEGLILAAWIYLGLRDLKVARRLAERGSRRVNPFDRWEARLVLASVDLLSGRRREALAELRTAVSEEPMVLQVWFHRAALLPTMQAMGRAVAAAWTSGDAGLEKALRAELGRVLSDPTRPRGSGGLNRALARTTAELDPSDKALVLNYARRGLEAAATE